MAARWSRVLLRCLSISGLLLALAAVPALGASFTGPTNFPAGARPFSVALGNFNGDSASDLAVANYQSSNVSVLLGDGLGGFTGPTNFPAGANPASVAVGNFNADTAPDLAVGNVYGQNVSILLGNGLGGFSGPTNFSAGTRPASVAVGNFNGDAAPDLAVANYISNNVSILLGNGLGGFTGPTNFSVGSRPVSVAVGNFNGGSDPDLAVANSGGNVSILLGNGSGGFTGPTNFSAGSGPASVAVGNFNGGSDPDLAVANSGGNVSILLGNGSGGFTGPTNFSAGANPSSVAIGDFDGDLDTDLAVADFSGYVAILVGDGLGAFSGSTTFPAGARPASVAVGNFNADPDSDLAVANSTGSNVSILLQVQETVAIDDVSRAEGDTGQTDFVFQIALAARSTDAVSVDYHTEDGTATTADSDYVPLPVQTLTFAPGETSKTVTVHVTGDISFEANEDFTLVLSDPINASIADDTGVGTIENDDQQGYPRPKGATPLRASLVLAFRKCNAPNLIHGPSLAYPSCGSPIPLSQYLTVGTPDANGPEANAVGAVRYDVIPGDPATQADEADVQLNIGVTDVRGSTTLGDYLAELWVTGTVRVTDRPNVAPATPATVSDFQFSVAVPCAVTPDTTIGSTCSVSTTADAVLPGSVPEKSRAIWQLGQIQVQDGGEDGEGATTADNTLFLKQGLFVP